MVAGASDRCLIASIPSEMSEESQVQAMPVASAAHRKGIPCEVLVKRDELRRVIQ